MSNPLLVAGGYGAPPIAAAAPTARVRLRADVLIPLLLSLLPVLLYLPFVNDPLDADAGVYSTVARGILHGQIPYRDLFDHKQPLLYTWYMLSFLLFGEEGAALRVLVLFHLAATTVMVYWCGCLLLGSRIRGYLAAAAFGLTPGMAYATDFGDARFLMLTPLVAGLLAYVMGYRSGRAWWYVASGALSGLAVTTVAVAALNLLALAVFTLYMGMAGRTRYLRNIGALGLGAGVVFVLAVLPFALTSTLGDFVYANVTFNLQYPTSPAFSAGTVLGLLWLFLIVAGPLVFLSGLGAWLFLRESPLEGRLLIGWVGASLAAFFLTGKMAEHYLIGLFPAMGLLAAVALDEARAKWRSPRVRAWAMLVLSLALAATVVNVQPYLHLRGETWTGQRYSEGQMRRMEILPEVAHYVARRTSPEEAVLYLGREPGPFYFYADRRPASRSILPCQSVSRGLLEEMLAALREGKPTYVLDGLNPAAGCDDRKVRPLLNVLLRRYYEPEGRLYFLDVYRLRPSAVGTGPNELEAWSEAR